MSYKSISKISYVLIISVLLSTTLFLALSPKDALGEGEQWLTGWQYRKSHVIDGSGTTAGTNYPVRIDVYYVNYTSLGTVITKAPMPTGLSDLPAVSYNNKIYTFGGYATSSGDPRNSTYSYDPATDTWTSMASMTYARWGPAAAVYDGIAYVFGGSPSYVEAYNLSSNSWTTKNSLPGPISAQGLMAVTVGNKIYLFCYEYAYQYDTSSDTYTALTNLPTGFRLTWGTCAYVNVGGEDRIYIIGGYNYAGGGGTNVVLYYRPAYNDWTQPSTNAPYAAYGTTRDNPVINGKIYYGYGNSQTSAFFYASMYAYDPSTGAWTQLTSGAYPRDGVANGVVNGKLYVIGGREVEGGPYGVNYNECFDPSEQTPINDSGQTVTASMKCRTDFGDIRFTASDGATQLNYWIQSSSAGVTATFWVRIPDDLTGESSTIYMYYGNPSATTTSNGTAVWTLFDDFEGANPLSNYNAEIGSNSSFTIAVLGSNHVLSYIGPVAWFLLSRTTPTFQNMRILSTMMPNRASGNYYTGLSFRETAANTWYFSWLAGPAGSQYAGSPDGPRTDWMKRVGGSDAYIAGGPTADLHNTWATMEVDVAGSSCKTYVNGVKKADATDTAITIGGKIGFMGLYASYWDDLCVGGYVNPEPAHGSWGLEEQEPSNPILTINVVGNGNVNLNSSGPYDIGDGVELTAAPAIGWSFDHWSGDLTGSANPETITMTDSMTVTATFTQNTYTLTVSKIGNGSVNLNNSGPYHYNDVVEFTAVPEANWIFSFWSGDLSGSVNPTTLTVLGDSSVTANFGFPTLFVSPPLVEKGLGEVYTTFNMNVEIKNVRCLWGFDFRLDWDNSLLTLLAVDYNSSLDAVWGSGQWFAATDNNGSGFYQLAAVSLRDGFNSTGTQTLATLTFRVEDPHSNFPLETLVHFAIHKLSDSQWTPIDNAFEDATYRMTEASKPALTMIPTAKTCRKNAETFNVRINISDAFNVTNFEFEMDFNTTLLDYSSITWNAWGTGNLVADEVEGKITGNTTGSPLNGDQALITIEFKAAYLHIWKDESTVSGWKNNQTGAIYFQWANLGYPTSPDLGYVRGGLDQIDVGPDVAYTFSPIQGDVDNDGSVDIYDLRTVAAFYDTVDPQYNLTGETIIDIYDLVVTASNFGYTYYP